MVALSVSSSLAVATQRASNRFAFVPQLPRVLLIVLPPQLDLFCFGGGGKIKYQSDSGKHRVQWDTGLRCDSLVEKQEPTFLSC